MGFIKETISSKMLVCYFNHIQKDKMFNSDFNVRVMSGTVSGAKLFEKYEDALDEIQENKLSGFDVVQVCPKCKKEFYGHPAISRDDNKTKVCSECGVREALEKVFEVIEGK